MFHNPKRLRIIETWARWLAWFDILSLVLNILILIAITLNGKVSQPTYAPFFSLFWSKLAEINSFLFPIFLLIANIFFLLGISKAVRFLRTYYAQITTGELLEEVDD